jgi:signal transduction histidine kinase
VAAAAIAAAIGEDTGISRGRQLAVLGALAVWAAVFTVAALRRGPSFPLVAADSAVVALALLALRPPAALVPVALVISAYIAGAPVVTSQVRVLIVQTVAVCAIMELLRRGGRRADALVAERDRERRRARVEAARRADERHHRAQMHDSVLATLTMVASGAVRAGSPGLEPAARRALAVMEEFAAPASGGPPVDLTARLRTLTAEMAAQLTIHGPDRQKAKDGPEARRDPREQGPIMVPEPVAQAITGAAGEALRNVARHAGTGRATLRASRTDGTGRSGQDDLDGPDGGGGPVIVEIADRGRGFEPGAVPASRQGIARSIRQRMVTAGGSATVRSRPGEGTRVVLRWPGG